jgi:hypothetical protein
VPKNIVTSETISINNLTTKLYTGSLKMIKSMLIILVLLHSVPSIAGMNKELERTLVCAIFAEQAFSGQSGGVLQNQHVAYAKANFGGFTKDDINIASAAANDAWKLELSTGMNQAALDAGVVSVTTLKKKVWASVLNCNDYK